MFAAAVLGTPATLLAIAAAEDAVHRHLLAEALARDARADVNDAPDALEPERVGIEETLRRSAVFLPRSRRDEQLTHRHRAVRDLDQHLARCRHRVRGRAEYRTPSVTL